MAVIAEKMKFVLYMILITIKIMINFWLHMAVSFWNLRWRA